MIKPKGIYLKADIKNIDEVAQLAACLDCGVEYLMDFSETQSISFLEKYNVPISVHSVFFDVNLASRNPYVVKESKTILKSVIESCGQLEIDNLVIHHNYHPYQFAFKEGYFVQKFCEEFSQIIPQDTDFFITLENVFDMDSNVGIDIAERIGRENVGLCFDIGHFNIFSEEFVHSWINRWDHKLFAFHLHNNYGKYDEHGALPDGSFDVNDIKDYFKNRFLTIENRKLEELEVSVEYLHKILKG